MSWKSLLSAGVVACVLSSQALADPSILAIPRPYSSGNGGIRWEVFVQMNDDTYAGSLSVELPLTLTAHTSSPVFTAFLNDPNVDNTNGAVTDTWYYNQNLALTAIQWNTTDSPANPADETQNVGLNPFTATETEGLYVDTATRSVFAALGSTVGLADDLSGVAGRQVRLLHILTSDGNLSWSNAIIGEDGVQYSGISGSASSIEPGDFNANGNANATSGAFQDPTTLADISGFTAALGAASACVTFQGSNPGLNCEKRGDFNNSGNTTIADIGGFSAALASGAMGGGAVVGGGDVPEPASALLLVFGLSTLAWRRRR
jgi:hypothetical protein